MISKPFLTAAAIAAVGVVLLMAVGARRVIPGARMYYVAVSGNDANPGTSSQPWRTIQKAANMLKAGDTVQVTSGQYSERVQVTKSGQERAPIHFSVSGKVSMYGFNVSGSYVVVEGFEIRDIPGKDLQDRAASSAIFCSGADDLFSNLAIEATNAAGIYLTSTSARITIRSNRIVSAVEAGIYVQGVDHLVESNDISHTVQTHPGMMNSADADGIRFFGTGSTFRKNYIHDITLRDSGNTSPHIDAFQTWGPASDMVIEGNTILQMESPDQGITIEGMLQPTGNIIIRNNVFMTNGTAYSPAVLAGDVGPVSNIEIVNNTFVALNGPAEYAFWLFPHLTSAVVHNNALFDYGNSKEHYIRIDRGARNVTLGTISISKSDGNPPAGGAYPGDLWMVNPRFVNFAEHDFHLQAESPLIGAGAPMAIVPTDFDGNPRPAGRVAIGAFERRFK
jgi:hypothetical protein